MVKVVSEPADERLQTAQHAGLDAVADAGTVDVAADEPGLLQRLQVLRDRGLSERQIIHDIATYARRSASEEAEYLHAGGVPDGLG